MFPIKETNQELTFAEQVDESIKGNLNMYNALKVCDTPKILLDVGCQQLPMLYTQAHLRNALHPKSKKNSKWHGLSATQIKKLPELIQSPVMIFDSITQNNSIVLVLSEADNDTKPVLVSIHPNGIGTYELKKIPSNFITSIYGKDKFEKYIENIVLHNKLLYWDKRKSQDLFRVSRLQLPGCLNNLNSDIIIHQSQNIINSNPQKNPTILKNKGADYMKINDIFNKFEQLNKLHGNTLPFYKTDVEEIFISIKSQLDKNPDASASISFMPGEQSNPNNIFDNRLWNQFFNIIDRYGLSGDEDFSHSTSNIVESPETKKLAISLMHDISDFFDGRLFFTSYIKDDAVVNESIADYYTNLFADINRNDIVEMIKNEFQQTAANAQQHQEVDTPNSEPTVTIIWSEHDSEHNYFKDGEIMSLSKANALFQRFNEEVIATQTDDGPAYYKTKFQIDYVMNGEPNTYTGRYDLGSDARTLIEHIENYHSYYYNNEEWEKQVLKFNSPEALKADKKMHEIILKEFVPYLKLHNNLSNIERISKAANIHKYVTDCRTMINQGNYNLPPVPAGQYSKNIIPAGSENPDRVKAVEQYRESIDNIIQYYQSQNKEYLLTHEFAAECIYTHNTDELLSILYHNAKLQPEHLQKEFLNLCDNLEKAIENLNSTEYDPEDAVAVATISSDDTPASITDVTMQETLNIDVNTIITSYDMAYLPIAYVPDMEFKQEVKTALAELVTEKEKVEAPTQKQIDFADKIAKVLNLEVTAQTRADYQQFIKDNIQAYQDTQQPAQDVGQQSDVPTQKQIDFADKIAKTLNLEITAQTRADYQQFIKENMEAYQDAQQHQEVDALELEKASEVPAEKQVDFPYTYIAPSEKQMNFANTIAETLGVELQARSKEDYQEFIEENMEAYQDARQHQKVEAPTEKQVNFANTIAETLGVELQAQTKADYQQFIKENVDAYRDAQQHQEVDAPGTKKTPESPTQKQIDFANKIVSTLGIELTAQTRADYQKFIDNNKEIYRNFEKMPAQSRPYTKSLNECLNGWKWEHQANGSGRLIMPDGNEFGKYDLNSKEFTITHDQQEQEWTESNSPIKKLELAAVRLQLNINSIDSQSLDKLEAVNPCIDGINEISDLEAASVNDTPSWEGADFGPGLA